MFSFQSSILTAILILSLNCLIIVKSDKLIKIPLKSATVSKAGEYNQQVSSYYSPISIGTPGQTPILVQFDVNLNHSWVPHYTRNSFKTNLHYKNGYLCTISSTCRKNIKDVIIEYDDCKLSGKVYDDIIKFQDAKLYEDDNNIELNALNDISIKQNFLVAYNASNDRFKDIKSDGFIGLSPQSVTSLGIKNPLINLYNAKLIDKLQFSFWFNPNKTNNNDLDGELTIGGVNKNRFSTIIYWHSLISKTKWITKLEFVAFLVKGTKSDYNIISCKEKHNCLAEFTTSLNDIYGPQNDVEKIYNYLNSTKKGDLHYVDCKTVSELPLLIISIGNITYPVASKQYITKTSDGLCYIGILPTIKPTNDDDSEKRWILGTSFLKGFYSIFNLPLKKLGFAKIQ